MATRPTAPSRPLLRDDAYSRLRDSIVDGTRAPGERLRDSELMEQLGIGRTPIREALLRLERAGLVETRPGHWTTVTRIDGAATRNAQEIAANLHHLAMKLAVPRMTVEHWQAMEAANARFAVALDAEDAGAALTADDAFHDVAVAASDNPMLASLLDQVAPLVRRVERVRFSSLEARDSVIQHDLIVALCRLGDAKAAARAVARNWQTLADTLATVPKKGAAESEEALCDTPSEGLQPSLQDRNSAL